MTDIKDMDYYKPSESLVNILMKKTHTKDPLFFRVLVAYHFAKVASMMRCSIDTPDRGEIPVNIYALNLAPSGFGKGKATNIIEEHVMKRFKDAFTNNTFNTIADGSLTKLAVARARKYSLDPDQVRLDVEKEFNATGSLAFSFDSGTGAAIKQFRHKLLMADIGSMCFEMDEVGSNFSNNVEVLNTFIELYDVGKIKQKIIKNTVDSKRNEEIDGRTPTNMLLFGTPSKLLDGSKLEQEFFSMLETGYARRCLFGYVSSISNSGTDMSAEEMYDMLTDSTNDLMLDSLAGKLESLADTKNYAKKLTMSKAVSIELIEYQLYCGKLAGSMKEHEEIQKAEVTHRYYRALKLAGAYAFIEGLDEITMPILHNAIKLVEDSGNAFRSILNREKPYVKLAKYIADIDRDITQVDLVEDLAFYKGSEAQRRDLLNLAIAYGYKNNIIIKKSYNDGIEFLRGESLQETDLSKMVFAYSSDIAYNYVGAVQPFEQLHQLTTEPGYHYTAHHFKGGHRTSTEAIPGFNLVIIDIDKGITIETAQLLLKDYHYLISTTKRHTEASHRFRIIMPLSHTVKLNTKDYSAFMENVFEWLPFEVDEATKDISRKWETAPGTYHYNSGQLLDAMLFIPQTKKSEDQQKQISAISSMSNLERWFATKTSEGSRSNMILKYALALLDNGYNLENIRNAVLSFNSKLVDGLPEEEINGTILVTVTKRFTRKEIELENQK
jgi:hypothetical protein